MERYGDGAGPELAGKLVKYTSVGCYPVFYLDAEDCHICAECANAEESDEHEPRSPVAAGVNWEDRQLYCDQCGERIESAYAEDE